MDELSYEDNVAYYSGAWLNRLPWDDYPACPCGLPTCRGQKLAHKTGHVVGCLCASCRGRENDRKGHLNQSKTHRTLGGKGPGRRNEADNRPYVVEVTILPESKEGAQVPKTLRLGLESAWLADALRQAEKAGPVGSGVVPAVVIEDRFLIAYLHPERRTVLPHSTGRRPLPQ